MENLRKIQKIQPLEYVGSYIANLGERYAWKQFQTENTYRNIGPIDQREAEELPGQGTGVHLCGLSEAPVDISSAEGVMGRWKL